MTKSILDTDILSEYLKGFNQTVVNRAAAYARQHMVFTITSITVYEVVYGLKFKGATSQLQKAMAWLGQNEEVIPVGEDYLTAATIKATARKQGSILELPDCLIASIAIRLKMPLVTGNTEDFRAIQKNRRRIAYRELAGGRVREPSRVRRISTLAGLFYLVDK